MKWRDLEANTDGNRNERNKKDIKDIKRKSVLLEARSAQRVLGS